MTASGDTGQDPAALTQSIVAQRGGRQVAEWEWLAERDFEFMAAYNTMTQRAFGYYHDRDEYPAVLSPKLKELITVAVLAGQRDLDRLTPHVDRLLDLGATDREILEALQTSAVLTGGPAMRLGIEVLRKARAARGEENGA